MKSLIVLASILATSIAMACPSDRMCSGDRMIDSSENVGRVLEVFSNGQARVDLDRYTGTYIRQVNTLGKGVGCFQHICVGDRIVDSSENVGTVKEVFDNGKARVDLDRYTGTYIRQVNTLGKGFSCIESVCVNDRMIDSSQKTGRILELFDNGKARVDFDRYTGTYIRSFVSLGIQLNCNLRENCSCRN